MGRMKLRLPIVLLVIGLSGCSTAPPSAPPETSPTPPATVLGSALPRASPAASNSAATYGGILRSGFACAAITPDRQPPWPSPASNLYELELPDGYTTTIGPVAIFGPDGQKIASEGERIEVIGTIPGSPASTCLSYVLDATEVRAARS
jgi:hypothetical protein